MNRLLAYMLPADERKDMISFSIYTSAFWALLVKSNVVSILHLA